jgi:hypothetical protein
MDQTPPCKLSSEMLLTSPEVNDIWTQIDYSSIRFWIEWWLSNCPDDHELLHLAINNTETSVSVCKSDVISLRLSRCGRRRGAPALVH